jgi:hypothetical protein
MSVYTKEYETDLELPCFSFISLLFKNLIAEIVSD